MALVIRVRDGETFRIGDVYIRIKNIGGKRCHVVIDAPADEYIERMGVIDDDADLREPVKIPTIE